MKTVYIPKGETVQYENLNTDRLVVKGCLDVQGDICARSISGKGVIHAGSIRANTIRADELEAASIICKKLLAKRVGAPEIIASDSMAISCFLSAAYVETGKLTVAAGEISEVKADEIVNLTPKKRGLWATLLASALRSFWVSLTTPGVKAEPVKPADTAEDVKEPETVASPENERDASMRREIAKTVREIMECERAAQSEADAEDFELKRITQMFRLLRDQGYTLRIEPGTPEENAPVFDFDAETIIQKAA